MPEIKRVTVPQDLMHRCVNFIGQAGQLAETERRKSAAFQARIDATVDNLARLGIVQPNMKQKVAEKLRSNPETALDYITWLAGNIRPAEMGKAASETSPSSSGRQRSAADEAFERHYK